MSCSKLVCLLLLAPRLAFAADQPQTLGACAAIVDDQQRLACFDQLAAQNTATTVRKSKTPTQSSPRPQALLQEPKEENAPFSLARHWELGTENKRGIFNFRPHNENYVLFANYSAAPNSAPFSPLAGLSPQGGGLSHTELKFQLGFKMKLLEDITPKHADLWFGYTQQSYWQAYNQQASSPFRESDYQPELMMVMPVDFKLLGMNARFVNVGLAHQSNGRTASLSRSWNRLYAQLGMEKDNFVLLGRVWARLPESASDDDNPDITDFMGHGDISGTYRWEGHEFSALARRNFHTGHGAIQLGWAFPLVTHLKGYVQVFSGYGQSLIDYNYYQNTVGIGVLVNY